MYACIVRGTLSIVSPTEVTRTDAGRRSCEGRLSGSLHGIGTSAASYQVYSMS